MTTDQAILITQSVQTISDSIVFQQNLLWYVTVVGVALSMVLLFYNLLKKFW